MSEPCSQYVLLQDNLESNITYAYILLYQDFILISKIAKIYSFSRQF